MKYFRVFICFIVLMSAASAHSQQDEDTLFQVSTIDALLKGIYDGEVTFAELAEKGNFGLGTFNALNGEMIALDGEFFQIRIDGKVYKVSPDEKTPFSVMTIFDADKKEYTTGLETYDAVKEYLDTLLLSKNIFYAIRIDGDFKYIKARSVPGQVRPYPPLAEVVKDQVIFEYNTIRGTIVGFWCPEYVKGVNVPGYHMHFISEDRTRGGHLLEVDLDKAAVYVDQTPNFSMALPMDSDFLNADLTDVETGALHKVER